MTPGSVIEHVHSNEIRLLARCTLSRTNSMKRYVMVDVTLKTLVDQGRNQGDMHYELKEYQKAVQCYEQAITLYGPKAIYMSNLAAALFKLKK